LAFVIAAQGLTYDKAFLLVWQPKETNYSSIQVLGGSVLQTILLAVQQFDSFTPDSEPCEGHDFGKIAIGENMIFWKIYDYDRAPSKHTPDPSDPTVTARVFTETYFI
jgi:hypothetical protein